MSTIRLNAQHWIIKYIIHKGEDLMFVPLNIKDSSDERPIRIFDAAAGTGKIELPTKTSSRL
jgi:hypothetical protein